jgi:hypothetical protein
VLSCDGMLVDKQQALAAGVTYQATALPSQARDPDEEPLGYVLDGAECGWPLLMRPFFEAPQSAMKLATWVGFNIGQPLVHFLTANACPPRANPRSAGP